MKNTMKKLLSTALVLLLFATAPAGPLSQIDNPFALNVSAVTSGKCGTNLTWSFNTTTGKLTISGTGDMANRTDYSPIPWDSYCSSIKSVTIENGVTSIGSYAFYECTSLTRVTIGNDVKSIGSHAFGCCYYLTSVTIPDSVTSIGNFAFGSCTSLTSATIGNGVTSIDDWAFSYCYNLTNVKIGNSVTSIADAAFYECTSLTNIEIPDSVTSIGPRVFWDCDNLTNVTIGNGVTSIGSNAFFACYLGTIYYTGTSAQWSKIENYSQIHTDYIICEAKSDKPYYLPGTCGDELTWVMYTNGELIIKGTGDMTNWLEYTSVPWYRYSSSIKSVTIGNGVTSIGSYALYNCDKLTSINIPGSVANIGEGVFRSCDSLVNISVDESNTHYSSDKFGVLFNSTKTELLQYPCANTKSSYTIPNSVKKIDNYAFSFCERLTTITIGDSVTSIGDYAFKNCKRLSSITFSNSVKNIGLGAFAGCSALTDVYYTGDTAQWEQIIIEAENDCLIDAAIHNQPHSHSYTSSVTKAPTCTQTGIRTYTCSCGDSYTEAIAKTAHTPGDWEITLQPTEETTGLKVKRCTICKKVLEESIIPKLGATVTIQNYPTTIFYKETSIIRAVGENLPSNAKINWSVSGGKVELSPSADSKSCSIRFLERGEIKITATVDGTTISDTVTVNVKYAWWQWIIIILLFGWIWY